MIGLEMPLLRVSESVRVSVPCLGKGCSYKRKLTFVILSFADLPVEYTARPHDYSSYKLFDIVKNSCVGCCLQCSCIFCFEIDIKTPWAYPHNFGMVINKKYNDLLNEFVRDLEHEGILENTESFFFEKVFSEAEKQAIQARFDRHIGDHFELDWVWEEYGMKNGEQPRRYRQKGLIKYSPYFRY